MQGLAVVSRIQIADREDTTVPGAEEAPTPVVSDWCGTRNPDRVRPLPVQVLGRLTVRNAAIPGGKG